MTKERIYWHYLTETTGLGDARDFVRLLKKVEELKVNTVIIADAFPENYKKEDLQSSLEILKNYYHFVKQVGKLTTHQVEVMHLFKIDQDPYEANEMLSAFRAVRDSANSILFVSPNTISHFLFYYGHIQQLGEPYFDENGYLKKDARWVLEDTSSFGNLDLIFRKSIGYAQPFPDAFGDGKKLLEKFIGFEKGSFWAEGFDKNLFPIEDRVRNSINLVNHSDRTIYYPKTGEDDFRGRTSILTINALGMGEYHTNTLVEVAKEKFGELSYIFILRRGKDAKEEVVGLGKYLTGEWKWAAKEEFSHSYMLLRFKDYQKEVEGHTLRGYWRGFFFAR